MTLAERIALIEQQQHLPSNRHPVDEPKTRRATPRWIEWTRENQNLGSQELTGYIREAA